MGGRAGRRRGERVRTSASQQLDTGQEIKRVKGMYCWDLELEMRTEVES